jgi:hypothetical protein
MAALCAAPRVSKYIGPFIKAVAFDLAEPMPHGTDERYGRASPVLLVVKHYGSISFDPNLYGFVDILS